MNSAVTKTISLLILIALGYIFRNKIQNKDQRDGIKTLILSLALPATIFIALLQIDFQRDLIIVPVLALGFNLLMFLFMDKFPIQTLFNIPENQYRTLVLLIPSLAPGLSCFPFIMEYSGQGPVAIAALADVGNKIFVLGIAYTVAMNWYYQVHREHVGEGKMKIKDLLISLINEPVNLVIVTAITMLAFGANYQSFPEFARLSIDRLSLMMTPLVLLLIGLSIKLTWKQVTAIFSFLFLRSSIAFLLSALLLLLLPVSDPAMILLVVVFPQSACSFWPYAHMAAVSQLEKKSGAPPSNKTFDLDFAMNVLACSMPFSVVLILMVYTTGTVFTSVVNVFIAAGIFLILAIAVLLFNMKLVPFEKSEGIEISSQTEKA